MPEPADDITVSLREQIKEAIASKTELNIIGGNSKAFYGRPARGTPFYVRGHKGIINYEPTELFISARCGTRLAEIEALLAENGQMLAFEPPYFGNDATLGGTIATGLSGARRPYAGSVRDMVLGVKLLNGHGEILKFGGEVMKNVAGFDITRLMVGALGTLGLVLEASIKVLPLPESETTLAYEMNLPEALMQMNRWAGQNLPLSAMSHDGDILRIRLSGAETAVKSVTKILGGDIIVPQQAKTFWTDLLEQRLTFFQDDRPLWRLSLAPVSPQPELKGNWLIDWGGALRWLKTDEDEAVIFGQLAALGGHACRFRSPLGGKFQPLAPGLAQLHRRIKYAFDPHGILNPGRLYQGG